MHYPPQEKAEKSFNLRTQLIENQGKSSALIRLIPELASELQECDAIRRTLKKGSKFVWTQLSCGIWAEEEKLKDASQSISNVFTSNEFQLTENNYLHLPHLLSILPMSWGGMRQRPKRS